MKNTFYKKSPTIVQNMMISMYNILAYRNRYGGNYKEFRQIFKERENLCLDELINIQDQRRSEFISYVLKNSKYYRTLYDENGQKFPIVLKEQIRSNIDDICTIKKTEGLVSKTGGTTGKSLEVVYTKEDMRERFAMLDNFREQFGYHLGKKTAWFSGKDLLANKDLHKNRFWKTDYLYKVRYYSTFHIKTDYLKYYIEDLIKFGPEYIVGFPSSISEIAKYGIKHKYNFPPNTVKAVFPTAETVTDEMRSTIETFFKTEMYDQYASSEGAPFIFECKNHNLHLELQSGVFEVLDDNDIPTNKGRLIVTSFTTHGVPLIRYDIGDSIQLSDKLCTCGNNNPLVCQILGRIDDYIFSPENGKINLGNVSNTLKEVKGIIKFQVVQKELNSIEVSIIIDETLFDEKSESKFISNWRDRVGSKMKIKLSKVSDIANEGSGKFRIVKNFVKHLVD